MGAENEPPACPCGAPLSGYGVTFLGWMKTTLTVAAALLVFPLTPSAQLAFDVASVKENKTIAGGGTLRLMPDSPRSTAKRPLPPSIHTALQEQLGLKLETRRVSTEMFAVDRPRIASTRRVRNAFSMPAAVLAQDVPPAHVAGGYSYFAKPREVFGIPEDTSDPPAWRGWFANVIGNITPHASVVAEISGTYATGSLRSRNWRSSLQAHSFLGGARAASRCCRGVAPFGQVLAGVVHARETITERAGRGNIGRFSTKYFALAFGGGADFRLTRSVGLEVAADMMQVNIGDMPRSGTSLRLRVGVIAPMR